jgi:hypothetical protein
MVVFAEGDQVRAKFMATKMGPFGTKFLPGVISKVYPDPGKKDDKYRYDINYENGKSEASVKAQFVKEPLAEAAGAVAPTPKPVLAPEAKRPEPKSVEKEVKAVAPQATPVAKPEPKSAQKASAGPTDESSKRESKLTNASPDGSDSEFAAKPSKTAASAAAASSGKAEASASSNKRVRKQVDYNAVDDSDSESEEDATASKSARAGASKGKAPKPKKVVAESESEEYEEPSTEGSGDEESEAEAEAEAEPEEVPKQEPVKAAPKAAERKPAAKKAVAAPPKKTKKAASPEPDSDSEEASDDDDDDEDEDEDEDDDAFDEEKAPVKKATKARPAARAKGSSSYEKSKWTEEEIAELPVLTKPQEMFDEMVAQAEARASTKGSALEGHSLAELAQRLEGRKLRVATMCSGTESPVLALDMISKSLFKQCGVQLEMDHVFSCEIEPFKQAYIERNFAPPTLFRDIRELDGEQASKAASTPHRSLLNSHPRPLTPHLTSHPSPLTSHPPPFTPHLARRQRPTARCATCPATWTS